MTTSARSLAWETRRAKYGPHGHSLDAYAARQALLISSPEPRVVCGTTYTDSDTERRIQSMRATAGFSLEGGCNKSLIWRYAYRCLECGRWMHAECLRLHFAQSAAPVKRRRRKQPVMEETA